MFEPSSHNPSPPTQAPAADPTGDAPPVSQAGSPVLARVTPSAESFGDRPTAAEDQSPAAELLPVPKRCGKYELRGELAHGGMGVVHKAHDPVLGRTVALK